MATFSLWRRSSLLIFLFQEPLILEHNYAYYQNGERIKQHLTFATHSWILTMPTDIPQYEYFQASDSPQRLRSYSPADT